MMIQLTPIVSRAKSKWYKPKKVKKLALNSQLLTVQILTNDVQVLILCLSYFITTVTELAFCFFLYASLLFKYRDILESCWSSNIQDFLTSHSF